MENLLVLVTIFLVFGIGGYLIGSIPFGLILGKIFGYGDIRKIGSGNIGATNALRTGNKPLAILTLSLDISKGAITFFLFESAKASEGFYATLEFSGAWGAAFGAILGHCYPVWLKFKGGKGVATTLGVLFAAVPWTGLTTIGVWLLTALLFRISSLAALVSLAIVPVVTFILYGLSPAIMTVFIAAFVFWRHKDNIKRLLKGEEPKINLKK